MQDSSKFLPLVTTEPKKTTRQMVLWDLKKDDWYFTEHGELRQVRWKSVTGTEMVMVTTMATATEMAMGTAQKIPVTLVDMQPCNPRNTVEE